jgi:hypothetical protein
MAQRRDGLVDEGIEDPARRTDDQLAATLRAANVRMTP